MYPVPVSFKLWYVADTCMQTVYKWITWEQPLVKMFEKLGTVQMFGIYVLFFFGYLKFKVNFISGKYNIQNKDS